MRIKPVKQFGLTFYAKITKRNGEVSKLHSHSKQRLWHFFVPSLDKFKVIKIRVVYKPGFINEGVYKTGERKECVKAWRAFTEEDLIRDALTY